MMNIREARLTSNPIHDAHVIDRLIVCMVIEIGLSRFRGALGDIIDTIQREGNEDEWLFWDAVSVRLDLVEQGVDR